MHPSIHSLPCTLLYVYTRIKTKPSISVLSILFDCINTVSDNKEFLRVIKQMATVLYSQVLNSNLKCYSVMNPVRIKIWLNLHNMMAEVYNKTYQEWWIRSFKPVSGLSGLQNPLMASPLVSSFIQTDHSWVSRI